MNRIRYRYLYSIAFSIVVLCTLGLYFFSGHTLVWWKDGWDQHYRALVYWGTYLRTVLINLISEHRLIIPKWEMNLGEGADVIQSLHYYVIGDPLNLLAVAVPTSYMYVLYSALVIVRMYLSGLFFSGFCFETGKTNKYAVLSGAIAYSFCIFAIINANRHPYFINTLVYFPLILWGLEKIFKGKRPYLYMLAISIASISNLYFFYVLVFMVITYCIVRVFFLYGKKIRLYLNELIRVFLYSFLGTAISAVIVLPMIMTFLGDFRMGVEHPAPLLYSSGYYRAILMELIAPVEGAYGLMLGLSATTVIALVFMWLTTHKYTMLKIYTLIAFVFMCIPKIAQFFNGGAYVVNRWSFAVAMLLSYILVTCYEELIALKDHAYIKMSIAWGIYGVIASIAIGKVQLGFIVPYAVAYCVIFLLGRDLKRGSNDWKNYVMVASTILCICWIAGYWILPIGENHLDEAVDITQMRQDFRYDETYAIECVAGENETGEIWRYAGRNLTYNADMVSGYSSTQYYWSISNPYLAEFMADMETQELDPHKHTGYGDNAIINILAGVKYYVAKNDSGPVPYGYDEIAKINVKEQFDETEIYNVYLNQYYTGVAYTYDAVVDSAKWKQLNSVEKQEVLLKGAVIEDYEGVVPVIDCDTLTSTTEVDYVITESEKVTISDGLFVAEDSDAYVTLTFDGLENSETYIQIKGLEFEDEYDSFKTYLRFVSSRNTTQTLKYYTDVNVDYTNRHDFAVNMAYGEEAITSITIYFVEPGNYRYDDINILMLSVDDIPDCYEKITRNSLNFTKKDADTISGSISADNNVILCLAIPFSEGWSAYVDGMPVTLYRVNDMHMGVEITPGEHYVEIVYETPFLKTGAVISLCAVIVLIMVCILKRRGVIK